MKFVVTFKDPDGVYDSVDDAARELGITVSEINKVVKKFFKYGEYVDIEIDMEAGTARVIPLDEKEQIDVFEDEDFE